MPQLISSLTKRILKILIIGTVLMGFVPLVAQSQRMVVSNARMNVVYLGVPNPINIAVEGYKCDALTIAVDNGKVEMGSDKCSYLIYPEKHGRMSIAISEKKSAKHLGTTEFRVKQVPDPEATVAGKMGGVISKAVLQAQEGIVTRLTCYDFDMRFSVTKATIAIIRKGNTIYAESLQGAVFTTKTKKGFQQLVDGDKVLISDIRCQAPDAVMRALNSIEFIISN